MRAPLKRIHKAACSVLIVLSFLAASVTQADWSNFGTVSMTDAVTPKLTNGYLCYSDGRDIACNTSVGPVYIGTNGLIDNGGMTVAGSVSASAVSSTYVSATVLQINPSTMPCSTGLNGTIRYSSVSSTLEVCVGTSWTTLSSNTAPGNLSGTGSATAVAFWSGTNSLSYDSGLYWDNTPKRLGVGTTAPAVPLDVSGTMRSRTNADSQLMLDTLATGQQAAVGFYSSGTTKWQIGKGTSDQFFLWDPVGMRNAMNVNSNGNMGLMPTGGYVGIGTSSPNAPLEVSGSILNLSQTGGENMPYVLWTKDGSWQAYMGYGKAGERFIIYMNNNNRLDIIASTTAIMGNLGIGTTAPGSSLTVIGEAQVGNSGAACVTATNGGAIRYSGGSLYYCNGANTWTALAASGVTNPGGATTNVQYNNNGALGGDANFTYVSGTGSVSVSGALYSHDANAYFYNNGTTPALVFDANDYLQYIRSTNTLGIYIGGVQLVSLSSAGYLDVAGRVSSTLFYGGDGTVGAPAYSFSNDTNSGFYRPASNVIGVSIGSAEVARFTASGLSVTGTVSASSVSATNVSGTNIQVGQSTLACAAGVNGAIRYNTTSNTLQICVGTTWTSLASGTITGGTVTGTGSATAVAYWNGTNSLTYESSNTSGLYWDSSNSRIGIGTNRPVAAVDISNTRGVVWVRKGLGGALPAEAGSGLKIEAGASGSKLQAYDYGSAAPLPLLLNSSGGNVGIGTSSPGSSLTIIGEAQVGNSGAACVTATNGGAIRYNAGTLYYCNGSNSWATIAGGGTVTGTGSATAVAFWNGPSSLSYDGGLYWDNSGKRLGIGTTTPSTTLHLYGVGASGNVALRMTGSGPMGSGEIWGENALYQQYVGGSLLGRTYWLGRTNGRPDFVIETRGVSNALVVNGGSGTVGIGTFSPTATLQVSGTFTVSNSAQGATSPSIFVSVTNGYVGIGTMSPDVPLTVAGATSGSLLHLIRTNSSLNSNIRYESGAGSLYAGAYGLDFRIGMNSDLGISPVAVFTPSNSVGIGTGNGAVPSSLTVVGEAQVGSSGAACVTTTNGGAIRYSAGALYYCNGANTWTTIGAGGGTLTGGGSATAVAFWNGASSLTYESATTSGLYWDRANSRLGIGTNTPNWALTVSGSMVMNTWGATDSSIYLRAQGAGNGVPVIQAANANNSVVKDLALQAYGGNVGIGGVITPTATLHISGSVLVSSSATPGSPSLYILPTGGVSIGSTTNAWVNSGTALYVTRYPGRWGMVIAAPTGAQSDFLLLTHSNAADQHAVQFVNSANQFGIRTISDDGLSTRPFFNANLATGSVGISNTNPIAKLDVWGTVSASDAIQVGQSNLTCITGISGSIRYNTTSNTIQFCNGTIWTSLASGTTGGGTLTGGGSATAIAFWNGPSSLTYESATTSGLYWNRPNSRLGIGTSSPSYALEISTTGVSGIVVSNTTTGVLNSADINLSRGDKANGFAGLTWATAGTQNWVLNIPAGSNDLRLWNAAAVTDLMRFSPSGTVLVSGTFTVSNSTQIAAAPSLFVASGGNVGVGSNNPSTSLQVSGTATANMVNLVTQASGALNNPVVIASTATWGPIATTSGTTAGFVGIPPSTKHIRVVIIGVSTNSTGSPLFQVGTSGGYVTSGYTGSNFAATGSSSGTGSLSTGFAISASGSSAHTRYGIMDFWLANSSTNLWLGNGSFSWGNTDRTASVTGSVTLSGTLDRVQLTGGGDTFDAGSIYLTYE